MQMPLKQWVESISWGTFLFSSACFSPIFKHSCKITLQFRPFGFFPTFQSKTAQLGNINCYWLKLSWNNKRKPNDLDLNSMQGIKNDKLENYRVVLWSLSKNVKTLASKNFIWSKYHLKAKCWPYNLIFDFWIVWYNNVSSENISTQCNVRYFFPLFFFFSHTHHYQFSWKQNDLLASWQGSVDCAKLQCKLWSNPPSEMKDLHFFKGHLEEI